MRLAKETARRIHTISLTTASWSHGSAAAMCYPMRMEDPADDEQAQRLQQQQPMVPVMVPVPVTVNSKGRSKRCINKDLVLPKLLLITFYGGEIILVLFVLILFICVVEMEGSFKNIYYTVYLVWNFMFSILFFKCHDRQELMNELTTVFILYFFWLMKISLYCLT